MAKLLTIDEWLDTTFGVSSRPSKKTVHRWLKKQMFPSRKIGGKLYIVTSNADATVMSPETMTVNRIAAML